MWQFLCRASIVQIESRMSKIQVLIIHNDIELRHKIQRILENATTQVICLADLNDAVRLLSSEDVVLIIIDAVLAGADDHKYLKIIRNIKTVPILLLSSNLEYPDRLKAFQSGANAYLGKPFELEECTAQAKSLINLCLELKKTNKALQPLIFGDSLIIEPTKRCVYLNGQSVELSRKEFDLLYCLAKHPGQVLSREQLYQQAWGSDIPFDVDEAVKSQIKTLRKKLSGTEYIKNVWGVGYCFQIKKDGE